MYGNTEITRKPNRLAMEKSPYLLQHATNPVDWYPWGDAAFEKAKAQDKPVFLSIGYSTCHWCHVMEYESFEDAAVAKLMNDTFVSVKVDREERPDIDNLYMTICQMLTGSGGWPLTIFLTADRKPFYATTYIPRMSRFGRAGMVDLIPRIKELWETKREDLLQSADQITAALQQPQEPKAEEEPGRDLLNLAVENLWQRYDPQYGGFGNAPKFPTPHQFLFLLRYWKRTGHPRSLEMVEFTLRQMRLGGIYDQIGFGFHRYSTDRIWLVPHFEKMLYDQALLTMAYTETYQATGKAQYRETAEEICSYVLRDMTSPEGGFYSAEDADSEGVEGKFYLWKSDEVIGILGAEEGAWFLGVMNSLEKGNFTDEITSQASVENIFHLSNSYYDMRPEERQRLHAARERLFAAREKRIHPSKDDKVLTDWNGLMIAALAKASRAFQEPRYAVAARRAVDFVLSNLRESDGGLKHRYRTGHAGLPSHVDDYAFFTWGLLELYEATFDPALLESALQLSQYLLQHFWDGKHDGLFFTSDSGENLLIRTKEIYDGAVPSGNSVSMLNLLRLARITGNPEWEQKAAALGRSFGSTVKTAPSAYSMFLSAVDFAIGPSQEVVIVGNPEAEDTRAMVRAVQTPFFPNKVVVLRPDGDDAAPITRIAGFTKLQKAIDGKATAYVCKNQVCHSPTTSNEEMLRLLDQ